MRVTNERLGGRINAGGKMGNSHTKQFTDATFTAEVLRATEPVLVDFWAPWCGPCRLVGPVIDELASEFRGRVSVGKVNVDDNPQLAKRYGVQSIPTLLVFKDGKVVDGALGAPPASELRAKLVRHLEDPSSAPRSAVSRRQ